MRRLLTLILFLLVAIPASAQIGLDGTTNFNGGDNSTFSFNATVTSSIDTVLEGFCAIFDTSAASYVSTFTYDGMSLTKITSQPSGTSFNTPGGGQPQNRTEGWLMLAPPTGTHSVVVTLAATPAVGGYAVCSVYSRSRVFQSLTVDSFSGSAGTAGAMSGPPQPGTTVTTSTSFDAIDDIVLNTAATNPQAAPPSSELYLNSSTVAGSTQSTTAAGTYAMIWAGMTNAWSQSVIALKWDGSVAPPVTYYIAPAGGGGNDSNSGLSSGSPWLTREHGTNCQDIILAAAGTYAETNFRVGTDSPVTCVTAPNMRSLKCVTFDACKINITSSGAFNSMTVSSSYSAIQGWEVTANSAPSTNGCFEAFPPSTLVQISYVGFMNDVCNGAGDGCFFTGWNSTTGVDYIVVLGNACYNGAQDSSNCYSGIDFIPLFNPDTHPGTHAYIAGNFTWGNVNPVGCGSGGNSDGQGIALDSLQESLYTGQVVIENNISVFNGATGIQNFLSMGAPVYIRNNTLYGNQTGYTDSPCGELDVFSAHLTQAFSNLIQTTAATACPYNGGPRPYVGISALDASIDDAFYNNFIYSASGNNYSGQGAGVTTCGLTSASGTTPDTGVDGDAIWVSCNTGSSSAGFTVTNLQLYTSTAAGRIYGAIYNDNAGSPGTPLCVDTVGVVPAANSFNTITLVGCGTLAPGSNYWMGMETTSAITGFNYVTGFTPCSNGFYAYSQSGISAPTWPNPATGLSGTGVCFVAYMNGVGLGPAFVNNITGTNPNLANPVEPPAPSCGLFANVPACMATMIANFKPTTASASDYGYHAPSAIPEYNPLFPQWLAGVTNLPAGLITMGTVPGSSMGGSLLRGGLTH